MFNIFAIAGLVLKEMYRRKDFYVLFILTVVVTLLVGSVTIFNDDKIIRFIKEICLFLIWLFMLTIAITSTARQIPAEIESRTIFPLLAKPVMRFQFIMGKFLGCWLACGLALIMFYGFFCIVCATRESHFSLINYAQAAGLHWIMLGAVIGLTLLGSLIFAAPSSNATICFIASAGILLLGRHLNKVALQQAEPIRSIVYSVYYIIPHLELFDVRDLIVHDWPPVRWGVCVAATIYALVFTAIFLLASWLLFRSHLNA